MADAQHRDLTAAFSAPAKGKDRAAALTGLLAPKPKPATDQEVQPDPATTVVPLVDREEPAPVRKRERHEPVSRERHHPSPTPPVEPGVDPLVSLPVYLPEDLRADMIALMPRGTTYGDVLVEAFEGVTEERLARYFTPTPRTSASGMPLAPQAPNPGTGPQRQFRIRKSQLDWITAVADRVNAPNRSVLCVAVLRLHLEDRAATGGTR